MARLEPIEAEWLECPQPDFNGKNPANILECERKRLPLIMSAEEAVIDEDYPTRCRLISSRQSAG